MIAVAQIEDTLQSAVTRLGFDEAKDKQKEAVVTFASGRDIFVLLPTGYGKSLCYSCLPACLPCLFDILGLQTGEAAVCWCSGSRGYSFGRRNEGAE